MALDRPLSKDGVSSDELKSLGFSFLRLATPNKCYSAVLDLHVQEPVGGGRSPREASFPTWASSSRLSAVA